jgi:hypothetical protein
VAIAAATVLGPQGRYRGTYAATTGPALAPFGEPFDGPLRAAQGGVVRTTARPQVRSATGVGICSYAGVVEISTERFRALARSSPWRWSTLRFVEQGDPGSGEQGPVRVLVRRPKMARLERLDGTLLRVIREEPTAVTPTSR